MENEQTQNGKDSVTERIVVKLMDLNGQQTLKNCTIGLSKDGLFGQSFMLFYDTDKIMFVNEKTTLGKDLAEIYEKIYKTVFDLTIKPFTVIKGNKEFKGWNAELVHKVKDRDDYIPVQKQAKLEGF